MGRRKVVLRLPDTLLAGYMDATSTIDIKQPTLDGMVAAGVDLTTDSGRAYIAEVAEAQKARNQCVREILTLATEHGYNPGTCTPISVVNLENTGAVSWMGPDDTPEEPGDEEA